MSSLDEHLELIGELRRRFPLFDRIVGQFGEDTQEERIPWVFGFFLAAAMRPNPGACCFVLDKTRGTTAIAAVLLALVKLQVDFPELLRNYALTALSPGQRVRVKPSDFVYEYGGLWEEYQHQFFSLRILEEKGSRRTFPITELLRLEPTDRVRPKGSLVSALGGFERSSLDKLLDLTAGGNNSVIRNTVLVYMAQARFAESIGAITLAPEHSGSFDRLSGFLPWGSIGPGGELRPNDAYQVKGEPILAVTNVPEDLALACLSASNATKIVFVDGVRGLARDLQAFDDIADRQRVVIIASPDETEALELLRGRRCPIWHLSPDEILIGEVSSANRARGSSVGATIRAAETRRHIKVTTVECSDRALQAVALSLERAASMIKESEEVNEVEETLARFYGILFECSECCFGVDEETARNLREVGEQISYHVKWIAPEVAQELEEATRGLADIIGGGAAGQEKADALCNIILAEQNEPWIVAARSPRTAESLRAGLAGLGVDVPVLPVSGIGADREYAGIIVPAWPNEKRFTRLRNQAVTTDIRVLAYPFESKWVARHKARERDRVRSNRMNAEARSSILGIEPRFLTALDIHELDTPVTAPSFDLPIFRIEDRITRRRIESPGVAVDGEDSRKAQLVRFFGNCHAILTEWAELHKINELIDEAKAHEAKLRTVTVSQLSQGDFVLFRAGGGKEFIRMIAEDNLGIDEYSRVRSIAERWKSSLRRLGRNPGQVQRRLVDHGLDRTPVTIAGWLGNPDRIGPGDPTDIEFIARAAGDAELLANRTDIQNAISHIRGAHISAGGQLTQLLLGELREKLNQLGDQPVLLDLGYAEAWVVQVDMVETMRREYPVNFVNRLLLPDETGF